jgi:hypothetical protein
MLTQVALFGSIVAVEGIGRLNGEFAAHQSPARFGAGTPWITAVCEDDAVAVPAAFVAITVTRRVAETSAVAAA